MNNNFKIPFSNREIDQNTIRILYLKNKMYAFPGIFVIAGIALFFFAVVPQVENYLLLKNEVKNSEDKIKILKDNIAVLASVNTPDLDGKMQAVMSALPAEKDFSGILNVIGQATTETQTELGDFSFSVGNVTSEATKVANALPIEISVIIKSDLSGTKRFIEALTKHFPLSEITTLQISEQSSSVNIIFYYKPLPQFSFEDNQQIQLISNEENALFKKLASFEL